MSRIFIDGWGAVSPAGWSVASLRDALAKNTAIGGSGTRSVARPGIEGGVNVLGVPVAQPRPEFLIHPRLRRSSAISQYAMGAVVEAVRSTKNPLDVKRMGVIVCIYSGSVNYSRRFYDETLKNPATASPLLFPETVFNAPASHISAYLGSSAINYTLVGDEGTFLLGLATGANWLAEGKVEACVVVASEEADWLTAEAMGLFDRSKIASEGAGALILTPQKTEVELLRITDEFLYAKDGKTAALERMKKELGEPGGETALYDSTSGERGISKEENRLWKDWKLARIAPRRVLGEGLMAATAWQCVAAADHIAHGGCGEALISCAGFHQHAIGAILGRAG